jgi:IPT/TIG domain-containing protein
MSMTPTGRRAVVLSIILSGLAGCGESKQFVPSAPSATPAPQLLPTGFGANSIFPTTGGTWRRTNVEILGAGFVPGVAVAFGSAFATEVSVVDSGTIWTTAPVSAAGIVDVVVINVDGARATLEHAYTFTPVPVPTLTPSAQTVSPGGPLSVTWSTPFAGSSDWLALFAVGSGSHERPAWWQSTAGATSGTLRLSAPSQSGEYEFRYLVDDHIEVARSDVVTVRQP